MSRQLSTLSSRVVRAAAFLCGSIFVTCASAGTLCPNLATLGGFGSNTATPFAASGDIACGPNSGETLAIGQATDYAKLQWNPGNSPGYPSGLTLGTLTGIDALVSFHSDQSGNSPFFLLSFHDASGSLGQGDPSDQILAIEFTDLAISDAGFTHMTFDPGSTPLTLFDNTAGAYLLGGQASPTTLTTFLNAYPGLSNVSLEGIWLAIGLAGGCSPGACAESLAVDTVEVNPTPEPATFALLLSGAGIMALSRRRRSVLS